MKKKECLVGNIYLVKVSGSLCPVKIVGENRLGGWDGQNLYTGRRVRIKSARRLRVLVDCDLDCYKSSFF